MTIEQTTDDILESLMDRRTTALQCGTTAIRSELIEFSEARDGRISARVDWHFLGTDGRAVVTNNLRYFCAPSAETVMKIESLEFLHRGFPERAKTEGRAN